MKVSILQSHIHSRDLNLPTNIKHSSLILHDKVSLPHNAVAVYYQVPLVVMVTWHVYSLWFC